MLGSVLVLLAQLVLVHSWELTSDHKKLENKEQKVHISLVQADPSTSQRRANVGSTNETSGLTVNPFLETWMCYPKISQAAALQQ